MKFITITILFALIACSLAKINEEDRWCGSSVLSVSIVTKENEKESITKAKLTVPVSLEKSSSHINKDTKTNQDVFSSGSLIKKNHEGIVFTLDGAADMAQIGTIYEKDEDSANDIYIPYAFIKQITETLTPVNNPHYFAVDLYFQKDFKTKVIPKDSDKSLKIVTIRFEADIHKTNICLCMFNFFVAKIRFNWRQRLQSLSYIRSKLFKHIDNLHANYKASTTIQGDDADKRKIETLKVSRTVQESQCSSFKLDLDMKIISKLQLSKKIDTTVIPNCETFATQIQKLNNEHPTKLNKIEADIRKNQSANGYGRNIDVAIVNSKVLEQHLNIVTEIKEAQSFVDALENPEKTSFEANIAIFNSIKVEYISMTTDEEIKYLKNASDKYEGLMTYFNTGFWKE